MFCCMNGHHFSVFKNSIFEKTTTPMYKWFWAIYLFSVSRNGVAAKELERQLDVTYKTAHRMAKQIRSALGEPTEEALESVHLKKQFFTSIKGTHHSISDRYFPYYLNEFVYKYQHRHESMTDEILKKVIQYGRA